MAAVPASALGVLMKMIGAPSTPGNVSFAQDWEQAEGGNADFNPFNTAQAAPGAANYNSVGVKSYPNLNAGLTATAQTLLNGHYSKLVSDLRSGQATPAQLAADVAASPWGTGSLVQKVVASNGRGLDTLPTQGAQQAVGSTIAALGGGSSSGASMADQARMALLNSVLSSSQSIASGQGVQSLQPQALLQLLTQSIQDGGAAPSSGTQTGASGADTNIVQAAKGYLGVPYKWGGDSKASGLDCSGFLQNVFKDVGINLPRTTYEQVKVGQPVNLKNLQPGDAVFTEPTAQGPGHVGLYIGNGQIQESPHTGEDNKIIPINDFLKDGFVAARRYTA